MRKAIEGLCAVASLVVILYTGVYLCSLDSVSFWHTPAIVALFLFSSLSAGASAMLLIAWLAPDGSQLADEARLIRRVHMAFIALEAIAVIAFLAAAASNPNAARSLDLLAGNTMLPTAGIGVGVMALGIPFATEAFATIARSSRAFPACDFICLVGGFILRYCVVFCGTH